MKRPVSVARARVAPRTEGSQATDPGAADDFSHGMIRADQGVQGPAGWRTASDVLQNS